MTPSLGSPSRLATRIAIRAPRAEDRSAVQRIVEAARLFRRAEVEIALEVFDGALASPGKDYHALGAYDADQLVGFACFGHTPGTEATWDLYWIAVDPGAYRGGVGRRLMAAAEDAIRAAGGRLIVVETSSRGDYAPTRAFYDALGYHRSARVADYYAAGDDLMVYTKRILPPPSSVGLVDHD